MMIQKKIYAPILIASLVWLAACKNEPITNPNAPTMEEIIKNPTVGELNNLATGVEGSMRAGMGFYVDVTGVIGREFFRHNSSEPRYTTQLLGKGTEQLSGNAFYISNIWLGKYNCVKTCNLLIEGTNNSKFVENAGQKNGYIAFAKTIMAHQMLLALNVTYDNGIRLEVTDPNHPGPIVTRAQALEGIAKLLDDAYVMLGGDIEFIFQLSSGFEDFSTPEDFAKFNRAVAARVALYQERWAETLDLLGDTYLDQAPAADLDAGPQHVFTSASGDRENPVNVPLSGANTRLAHPSYMRDIEAGDDRINKSTARATARSVDGLPASNRDFAIYPTLTTPMPILRNEELILIYAEAQAQLNNFPLAAGALNLIRTRHGLAAKPAAALDTKDEVIDELLVQRRFSLWGEGHRWIDLRRYNRLGTLPIDRANDDVWTQLPLPQAEEGM
ncbi:RagB/SusD family nutrient uptake outer membrane protein [Chitinophaga barathri]|uniref:RagB/SusD family nutrient uptake outer membrane protein n=1 Tax=Chitinophaga barathri TaxID=1647451 RepID=A0A3N4MQR6_9BACT|nr:RagB/SusD family nutrient uptake outer membrane protein [Chitinophaga barathri]RPD42450.1 RagB/SusD family nutrient uptake outer membrane protein [Chitinophaga barathri]